MAGSTPGSLSVSETSGLVRPPARAATEATSLSPNEISPPYSSFAAYYEQAGWTDFARSFSPVYLEVAAAHGVRTGRVLDLGCGDGTACEVYWRAGWRAHGVDLSPQMLRLARRRRRMANASYKLSNQDMTNFRVRGRFDLVTCMFDATNAVLSSRKLARMFRRVGASLRPGGLFLFDIVTLHRMAEAGNEMLVSEQEGMLSILRRRWNERRRLLELDLTLFAHVGRSWRRIDEQYRLAGYELGSLRQSLNAAGLATVASLDLLAPGFPPATDESRKVLLVAKRN